ncbi:N-acetyltransferase [Labrenzia sp. 011]|uniref:GNAT family N-acetyltransferase n=1 Tax=Labrenzia sp. 011 TaxID=2171494 RepID=UPI000D51A958|nr:N-acetyltransferase [Labrenzia sp. 011]PVB62898.1 GNAT family N-acetyltransferase [Labrenzia sp. 011]
MSAIEIRQAGHDDVERLHFALERLSQELGDLHATGPDDLLRHGFRDPPAFFALIATRQAETVGAVLASPLFSTTRGGAGLYVSDLWVAKTVRGAGLGKRLLAAVADHAPRHWNVTFVKLAVYHDSADARRFYQRLGFEPREGETVLDLQGPALTNLRTCS